MFRSSFGQLLTLLALLNSISSFHHNGFDSKALRSIRLNAASTVGRAGWADDESLAGQRDISSRRKLNATFVENLDCAIGSLITSCALNTVSYYMLEFHDEVNEKWMMGFANYKRNGQFPGGLWTNYIEKMITTDKTKVEVLIQASTATLRSKKIPEGRNVMMQYFHDIEPRKVAHQIITVREDVSSEMIQDLGCIKLENEEAIRYASTWARDGKATAEKSRRMFRMDDGESTPERDLNYKNFDVMITALAMQLVRDDLVRSKDHLAIEAMDNIMITVETDDKSLTMAERVYRESQGPSWFMEQLYYKGITDNVVRGGSKTVNMLKVAENFFDARLVIAKEASKLLSLQSMQNRHYYKMIKDYGGFQKLDMSSGVPKITFIDLDLQAIEDAKVAAEDAALKATELAKKALEESRIPALELKEIAVSNVVMDADDFDSGSGPMMM